MKKFLLVLLVFLSFSITAQASEFECGSAVELAQSVRQNQSVVVAINQSDLLNAAWSCTKNFFMGVWDATGGTVADAWNCVASPIDCGNAAITGLKNAWNFVKDLSENMKKMYESIAGLTTQQKVDLLCEMIGSIGTSVAIGILTAGAASAVAVKVIAGISLKMMKLGKILRVIRGVTPRKLARLPDEVLEKAEDLTTAGYGRVVREAVEACPL